MEIKREPSRELRPPLLSTDLSKLPISRKQKQHSIFTPVDENRSMLSQHLAAFHPEPSKDSQASSRSQSLDVGSIARSHISSSPPMPKRSESTQTMPKPRDSISSVPETTFTPPSRQNSLRIGGGGASRPRLRVEIPEEASDGASATAESASPKNSTTDAGSQSTRRNPTDSHSSGMVLPPPSPSASAILSAGATGPPNPFARPPPQQHQNNMSIETPVSALPSRFLTNEFLPSPSQFYPEWNFSSRDNSNTLPSPLNFATPVVGTGPSFLRDDNSLKRKSPDLNSNGPTSDPLDHHHEPKRIKVDS